MPQVSSHHTPHPIHTLHHTTCPMPHTPQSTLHTTFQHHTPHHSPSTPDTTLHAPYSTPHTHPTPYPMPIPRKLFFKESFLAVDSFWTSGGPVADYFFLGKFFGSGFFLDQWQIIFLGNIFLSSLHKRNGPIRTGISYYLRSGVVPPANHIVKCGYRIIITHSLEANQDHPYFAAAAATAQLKSSSSSSSSSSSIINHQSSIISHQSQSFIIFMPYSQGTSSQSSPGYP